MGILPPNTKTLRPYGNPRALLTLLALGVHRKSVFMDGNCAYYIVELFRSSHIVIALVQILCVVVDRMRMAQVALSQQVTKSNYFVRWPRLASFYRHDARHPNCLPYLQFVQQPPAVESIERVIGSCLDRAPQRCRQSKHGFDAIGHDLGDLARLELKNQDRR